MLPLTETDSIAPGFLFQERVETNQYHPVRLLREMERGPFNVSEDCAQAAARDSRRLIRPNHHDRTGAFIAPCFDGSVAPSDDENALRFNRDLCSLLSRHS